MWQNSKNFANSLSLVRNILLSFGGKISAQSLAFCSVTDFPSMLPCNNAILACILSTKLLSLNNNLLLTRLFSFAISCCLLVAKNSHNLSHFVVGKSTKQPITEQYLATTRVNLLHIAQFTLFVLKTVLCCGILYR